MSKPKIAIIGAGMSGLCMAMKLKLAGIDSLTLFEKSSHIAGTWAENVYPNAGCDVPSFLYSFSFEPKLDWSQKYARQAEILEYFKDCVNKHQIEASIRFDTTVVRADFMQSKKQWMVEFGDGVSEEFDYLISAVGQLNQPSIPDLKGGDDFSGTSFHTAKWDRDFDATDKNIVVIGAGASAVQLVPELAKIARKLTLFQRSPNWIAPLGNYRYPKWAKTLFRKLPLAAKLHRLGIFLTCDSRYVAFRRNEPASWIYTKWLEKKLTKRLDADLLAQLLPDYPAGCKRILLSSDFYDAIERDNVELVTDSIKHLASTGVETESAHYDADAIIYATGFQTSDLLTPMEVIGRSGISLSEQWKSQPGAYLGMMVPNFPNFFVLYGPNTNLGHNSIIYMVECQVNYIIQCIQAEPNQVEVTQQASERFQTMLQKRLAHTVWNTGCTSWYKNEDGMIINNWCGPAIEYYWRTRRPKLSDISDIEP